MIVALTGLKRSGKSEVCSVLEANGFTVIGFADTLKAMALAIDPIVSGWDDAWPLGLAETVGRYGWERVKDDFPQARRFLQRLGTDGVRDHLGHDTWVRAWAEKVALATTHVAVPDCRFLNEAATIRDLGGQVWRVVRGSTTTTDLHVSEQEQAQIEVDFEIRNDGTLDDLHETVRDYLKREIDL